MKYELTIDGRNDERICLNVTAKSLDEARKEARKEADARKRDVMIERVTKTGNSSVIERVAR